jgi:hypothetical protein
MTIDKKAEQDRVRSLLARFDNPGANNAPVLGINIERMQIAKNGGYPKWLYHREFDAVQVKNMAQEQALADDGYYDGYRHKEWPRQAYRRNWKKEARAIPGTREFEAVPKFEDFIETRIVDFPAAFEELQSEALPHNCSPWVLNIKDLPNVPDADTEDPAVTIARLQGQLEAMQGADQPRRGPGRPPKEQ